VALFAQGGGGDVAGKLFDVFVSDGRILRGPETYIPATPRSPFLRWS
jgi:hypothetical protein